MLLLKLVLLALIGGGKSFRFNPTKDDGEDDECSDGDDVDVNELLLNEFKLEPLLLGVNGFRMTVFDTNAAALGDGLRGVVVVVAVVFVEEDRGMMEDDGDNDDNDEAGFDILEVVILVD